MTRAERGERAERDPKNKSRSLDSVAPHCVRRSVARDDIVSEIADF